MTARGLRGLLVALAVTGWLVFLLYLMFYGAGMLGQADAGAAEVAPQAWWSLSQSAMPTYVSASRERSEVQQIEVSEKNSISAECTFGLSAGKVQVDVFNGKGKGFDPASPEGTPENVQTALEGETPDTVAHQQELIEEGYGPGNVEVSEGAPSAVGCRTLLVKSVNGALGANVAALNAFAIFAGAAHASKVEEGVPAGEVVVRALDVGDGPVEGAASPVLLKDLLPAGFTPVAISGKVRGEFASGGHSANINHGTVTCSLGSLTCEYAEEAAQFNLMEVRVKVDVQGDAKSGQNTVSVQGGGAPPASRSQIVIVSGERVPFGVELGSYSVQAEEEGGVLAAQAGAHPFQLTTSFAFDNTGEGNFQPALPRGQNFDLPAGLVGDAQATAHCTLAQFTTAISNAENQCPAQSAIGVAVVWITGGEGEPPASVPEPVFNLVPAVGEPARFGLYPDAPVLIDTALRSGSDYGVTASVHNLTQGLGVFASTLTLWGAPGDAAHNSMRGWKCVQLTSECATNAEEPQTSLLTMPSQCGKQSSLLTVNSWANGEFVGPVESSSPLTLEGCNQEQFEPEMQLQPTTSSAYTPVGVNVHLKVPQEAGEQPQNVAEADVRNTTVTLPAGLQINPAAAAGLTGCTEQEIGYEAGRSETEKRPAFTEESEAERLGETPHRDECPESSRIGKVTVHSNLLPEPITGYVYQAAQNENPFKSLLALYVVAEDKKAGVRVRLAGEVKVQSNGQLVSSFLNTPQVPFEEFTLEFFGGASAPLATSGCGEYPTTTSIEPWSSGSPGEILATPGSLFDITSGPGGSGCSSTGGFAPAFAAGTTNNDSGAFSPLTVRLARKDGEQTLSTVAMKMPPGLAGMISEVQLCAEAQANAGDCPAASKIGHVQVSAGVGNEPIELPEPGKPEDPVYITGPYKGAPFGLSIVAPAEAGPFNLGTVVLRGKINIDPHTAQVSIETEPAPTRLQGIPLDLRSAEAIIDKPGFTYNPTNCQPMSITGTIGSSEGASEPVSSHFEAANCATLRFTPAFKVITHKKHTRRYGAYLRVKVTPGSGSGQANLKSIYVELPKVLPSRQETLKLACPAAQYAANPAGCPAESRVGTAIVHTPVLPVPLTGPATLVSHGGAAFPDLDLTLQGDGVTIEQTGTVNIAKGVTSTDFESVPDAPISSIEMTLPEGAHSVLAATANLCFQTAIKRVKTKTHGKTIYQKQRVKKKRKLNMPTVLTAQNGAIIKQTTQINVEGCSKG